MKLRSRHLALSAFLLGATALYAGVGETSTLTFNTFVETAQLPDPFDVDGYRFTSPWGTLQIQDDYNNSGTSPGGWPDEVLAQVNWGKKIYLERTNGIPFNLISVDLGTWDSDKTCEIIGTYADDATVTNTIFVPDQKSPLTPALLNFTEVVEVRFRFFELQDGEELTRIGLLDNIVLKELAPPEPPPENPAEVTNIHSTFGADATTDITVSWRNPLETSATGQVGQVEFGASTNYGSSVAAVVFESGGGLQYHAELTGLQPGTRYHYRTHSGTNVSRSCSFRTALPADTNESFTFAVLGDVEGSDAGHPSMPELSKWLIEKDPDFFMVLGDLVYYGQTQSGWDGFFQSADLLFESCVFAPILGDHSMERLDGNDEFVREAPLLYLDQLLLPDNGTLPLYGPELRSLRGIWYGFDYGSARIISMEGTQEMTEPFRDAVNDQQATWVTNDLAQTSAAWHFLMSHRAFYPYPSETTEYAGLNAIRLAYRTKWDSVLSAGEVDLAFGAHIGNWNVSHPIINGHIAGDGEHGTTHIKLPKVGGNYSKEPDPYEVNHWATALPTTTNELPATVLLITVRPNGTDVESWTWPQNSMRHSLPFKPQRPGPDADGDTVSDYEEFVADTDAADSNDFFRATALLTNSTLGVSFQSSSNRLYTLEKCTNLTYGIWTSLPERTRIPGIGGPDLLIDTNETENARFYRLQVELP